MLTLAKTPTTSFFARFFAEAAKEAVTEAATDAAKEAAAREAADISLFQRVDKAIEKIRYYLQQDGGDISLEDVKDGIAVVSLEGHCVNCHSKKSTLNHGVLGAIQDEVPEIVGIREKLDFEDL